ncbi:UNVERIFIED_CONTAM: putative plastid-lipid-associated protein 11, chloroplastic [Sesamum radiatum]|uniref:Plastid-lipid-associated protein 11, chloroplastic n=1 Tax=Sesamum radiatum TaxID=300843 RepID=A0AAW2V7T0_SESRA
MAINCLSLPATPTFPLPSRSFSTVIRSSLTGQSQSPSLAAKRHLLRLIADQDRGIKTQSDPQKLSQIIDAIDSLAAIGRGAVTTDKSLSATWRMLWTTEKEQLFIIKNAPIFGTSAGDVLQVIDVDQKTLNNVIFLPMESSLFGQRFWSLQFKESISMYVFTSAVLRGKGWEFPLPPFGQGWFESLYIDDEIRVVKDIRQDYLIVERAPYSWKE